MPDPPPVIESWLSSSPPAQSYRRATATLIFAVAVVACVESKPEPSSGKREDSLAAPAGQPPQTSSPAAAPIDSTGAGSFVWTLSALELRLRERGMEPVALGEVRQPFIGGPGMRYGISGGEVQAFVYADAGAVARDTDQLDTIRVSPPTMTISWVMPPKLVVSNNLVLIVLTRDAALRERVSAAVKVARPTHRPGY